MFAESVLTSASRPTPDFSAYSIQNQRGRFGHAQIAHQFLVFVVVQHHLVAAVEQGDHQGCRVDDRFDQRLLVADFAFESMQQRDVALDAEIVRDFAVTIDDGRDQQIGEILAPVLAPVHQAPTPGQPARDHRPQFLIHRDRRRLVG